MVNVNTSWYAYPNSTDSLGTYEIFNYINNVSNGLFFPVILLTIWFVVFIAGFNVGGRTSSSAAKAWTFSCFITSVFSILLSIMNFLNPKFMYLSFILLAVGLLWLKISSPTID